MKKVFIPVFMLLPLLTGCGQTIHYADAETYTQYESAVLYTTETPIKNLEVDWIAGEIEIKVGDYFSFEEKNLEGKYHPLYYRLQDETLDIKYCQSDITIDVDSNKKISITVPESFETLDLDLTSGKYSVEIGSVTTFKVDMTSGGATFKANTIDKFDIDVTSGHYSLEANSIKEVVSDLTSGRTQITTGTLETADFNFTSGTAALTVNDSTKLKQIDVDVTSGSMTFNYDGVKGYYLNRNGKGSVVEGSDTSLEKFNFNFSCTSGSLTIN